MTSGQSNLATGRIAAAHRWYSLYFTMGCPFPLRNAPFHGWSGPLFKHGSLGPPDSSTQMASWSVQLFCRVHYCDRQTTLLGL